MAKKAEKQSKLSPGRHSGEYIWGYEVREDGAIHLCPGMMDRMAKLTDRRMGLLRMQEGIAKFVADELARVQTEQREWFGLIQDEFTDHVPPGSQWLYDGKLLKLKPEPAANAEFKTEG
jgi:hypothetical protein